MPTGTGTAAAAALWTDQNTAEVAKKQAAISYVTLLNADSGQQADIDATAAAARLLGKSAADVAADYKKVLDAKALVASIQSRAGCGTVLAFLNAYAAKYLAAVDAQTKRLDVQRQALNLVLNKASLEAQQLRHDVKQLTDMKIASDVLVPISVPDAAAIESQAGVTPEVFVPSFAAWLAAYVTLQTSALASSAVALPAPPA